MAWLGSLVVCGHFQEKEKIKMTQQSLISKVHEKVSAAEKHYVSIEEKCNAILAFQKKSRLSPLWIALMVIGAFAAGGWFF